METAEDVLAGLRPILGRDFAEPDGPEPRVPSPVRLSDGEANRIRACLEEALGPAPVEVDELVRGCNSSVSAVLSVLLEMELAGRVTRHSGNRVSWA